MTQLKHEHDSRVRTAKPLTGRQTARDSEIQRTPSRRISAEHNDASGDVAPLWRSGMYSVDCAGESGMGKTSSPVWRPGLGNGAMPMATDMSPRRKGRDQWQPDLQEHHRHRASARLYNGNSDAKHQTFPDAHRMRYLGDVLEKRSQSDGA